MSISTLGLAVLVAGVAGMGAEPESRSVWQGYEQLDFVVDGRSCLLVLPKAPAHGHPWIWRTEFFGHEPQADIALLGHGFHVAYMDVQNLYGSPVALDHMDKFYEVLRKAHGLSKRTVLEGFSRGGLFAFNWAARNPKKVACMVLDAPVCDFKSWPGGKGIGPGSPEDWQRCLQIYHLTEEDAMSYKLNPVDNLKPLAEAGIPLLHVCGEADEAVPIGENTRVVEKRYQELGGDITVISKPFCKHHPHSLHEPAPIVRFVLKHTLDKNQPDVRSPLTPYGYDYFVMRNGLPNCRVKFEREKKGRVAFLGGSITAGPGWRDLVCADLQRRFPETQFEFINAGIPSMGSVPGSFRFSKDVLGQGPVDLLIEEAAVNDETNGSLDLEPVRGMEGIVRQARLANPSMDILLLHFADPSKTEVIRKGETPVVIVDHERVAEYYGLPSINLAQEVTERIRAGEFTWEGDFKDLHPSPFGHELYCKSIQRFLDADWKEPLPEGCSVTPYPLPESPLNPFSYFRGKLLDVGEARAETGWVLDPKWRPTDGADTRPGFVDVPALVAETQGASLRLKFEGSAIGILVAAGPDAGAVSFRIDSGPEKRQDLFTAWSGHLHLPWAYVLVPDLPYGPHELELWVDQENNSASKGHAVRILHFLVN